MQDQNRSLLPDLSPTLAGKPRNNNKSEQKNVIQRINSGVSTRSGFVIPLKLDLVEKVGPKRTRKCLEWKLVAMTGKLICIKMSFLK